MNNFNEKARAFIAGRNFSSGVLVAIIIAVVVFVNIIAYTLTEYFELYVYVQEKDDLTIGAASDDLFEDARDKGYTVSVTFCMDEKELSQHATGKFVYETAREFKKRYPDFIKLNYVNVYTQLYSGSEEYESGTLFNANDYMTYVDPVSEKTYEYTLLGTSVIFEYKPADEHGAVKRNFCVLTDNYTTAGFADFYTLDSSLTMTSYNGQEVFASMCAWVLSDHHETAYITTGHGESADPALATALQCAGYYVEALDLKRQSVPEDAGLVVISNPKSDFEKSSNPNLTTEIRKLEAYRDRGGNFYITLDPIGKRMPVIESFVAGFGISAMKDSESGEKYIIKDTDNAITTDGFTLVCDHASGELSETMYSRFEEYGGNVILRYTAALELVGEAKPLLVSSTSSECQVGGKVVNSDGSYAIAAYSTYSTDSGKESKLFFIPSIYLTSTDAMVTDGYSNKNFLFSLFGELYGEGNMPYGCTSITFNDTVLENLKMSTVRLYTAILLIIPAAVAVTGAVVLIRRKNR